MYDDYQSLLGPFKDAVEISRLWYQVEEKHLKNQISLIKESIEAEKRELKKLDKSPSSNKDKELIEESIQELTESLEVYSNQLQELQSFVENYIRCTERFKHKRKILNEIEEDWREYNLSLYSDYCDYLFGLHGGYDSLPEEKRDSRKRKNELEKIKREEITKKVKDRLL